MTEERREGYIDLKREFQRHVELSLQVQQDFQTHVDRFDEFEDDLLTVITGPEDPLTNQRTGGMRGDIGELKLSVTRMEYKEDNGGVNAKVKLTFWQRVGVAAIPVITGGSFALMTTWLENQG